MFHLVYEYPSLSRHGKALYRARAYGELQSDDTWGAWLIFFPIDPGAVVSTSRETTQRTFAALSRWSTVLSPAYLEGALERALALQPELALVVQLTALEKTEKLEHAARVARRAAKVATASESPKSAARRSRGSPKGR